MVNYRVKQGNVVGGFFLLAGTCIGAGMLSLPPSTCMGGFFPSVIVYFLSWLLMMTTSFIMLEVNLWMKKDVNIISMADQTLGRVGKSLTIIFYIFLFYSVCIAYLAGSGKIITEVMEGIFRVDLPTWQGIVIALFLFGSSLYFGTKAVAYTNIIIMCGLIVSYVFLTGGSITSVQPELLTRYNWFYVLMGVPVIILSFTSQNVIPSVAAYLGKDVKRLIIAIIVGGLMPLFFYIFWQYIVLGIVPVEGAGGLKFVLKRGLPATYSLKIILKNPFITSLGIAFSLCAIATSFLGVILGLFDFLSDGLKIEKKGQGKVFLCALIFIPPLFFAIAYPNIFHISLRYAAFGCTVLFVLLPSLMAWSGRYYQNRAKGALFQVIGGKALLGTIIFIGLLLCLLFLMIILQIGPFNELTWVS